MEILSIFGSTQSAAEETLRDTGELTIEIPALPRPTLEELQAQDAQGSNGTKSIERDTSPVTPVTLTLKTFVLPPYGIEGDGYERRLKPYQDVLLGFQHQQWLLAHLDEYPALKEHLGKVYIDFPGIVVRSNNGSCYVPCISRRGYMQNRNWSWFDLGFLKNGRVAVART